MSWPGVFGAAKDWAVGMASLATGLFVAVLTYLGTRRKQGGTVRSSEASELWGASEELRKELRMDLQVLRAEVQQVRTENVALNISVMQLQDAKEACMRELDDLRKRIQ